MKKLTAITLGLSAMFFAASLSSCHNDDTNTEPMVTDSSSSLTRTQSQQVTAPTDTATPAASDTTHAMAPAAVPASHGAAKPNPAKKGKTGKVTVAAQSTSTAKADAAPDATGVYKNVDHIPAFPGGAAGLQKYFDSNIQYPRAAEDAGVEGTTHVSFTVDENGKILNPTVEGEQEGYGLDEEAVRVVKSMPAWVPGKINGKPVKTHFVLPVQFTLQ